jgi:hypothetical protein
MTLLLVLFSASVTSLLSAATADPLFDRDVLADAKHRSVASCSEPTHRCTFRVVSDPQEWWVLVDEAVVTENGSLQYAMGLSWGFHYTLEGKYLGQFKGA